MNFHMNFLIFKKYFKYIYIFDIFLFFEKVMEVIILIDYFIFITVRVFKYLLLTIFIICKNFFILFSIVFMVRFAFTNIYINVTSNDNVNITLDETLPVASMAGVRIDYWQERSMSVSDTPKEDTESLDYIFRDSCLSYLNNKITTGFESGLFTGMILIDLQKAFDTINHDILIKKMTFLGFSEETTNWFKSYLTNRKFIVHINNSFSEPGNLLCGVPQGSTLGPLPFLLYINDMPQAVTCDLLLYADDTCLVFQHKDVIEIETVLNKNFSSLCDWFIDNKLSIYFGEEKTKSILSSSKHKVKKCKPLNIHYKNIKRKQYSKVTYLGCILDETLSDKSMAIHVINKINSRLRFLYRQNRYLSFPLRRLLCNAMIRPFFDYASNAWYPNINKKLKTRLQAAQNKCIRFCLKLVDRFRLKSKEFERINWLPVQERISQCAVCNVYKFFLKHSPSYFEELFFPTEETAIRTRSSFQKLKIPRRKTNIGLKSLSYTGPSLWNNLNENLKRSSSINDFKHEIKEFYFEEFKNTKHES